MIRGFIWTAKRDELLTKLRRQGLTLNETARALGGGADAHLVRERCRALGLARPRAAAPSTAEIATVPRPVAAPASVPRRKPLIDISKAPSAMEQRADRWAGRA